MVIRILLGFFGFVLLYVAAFMYENDQKQLKDRLGIWWISLEDRREKARNWLHVFVPATAATVNQWYEHVFGPALLSSDFFITSTLLSSGCLFIALTAVQILVPHKVFPILRFDPEQAKLAYVISAALGVVMLYASLIVIRARLRRTVWKLAVRRLLILAVVYVTLLALYPLSTRYYEVNDLIIMIPLLGVAIGSDLLAIVSTRITLRRVVHSRSLPISFLIHLRRAPNNSFQVSPDCVSLNLRAGFDLVCDRAAT